MLTVGYIDSLSELGFRTPTPEWVKTERYDYLHCLLITYVHVILLQKVGSDMPEQYQIRSYIRLPLLLTNDRWLWKMPG